MFFHSWWDLIRLVIVGTLAYVGIVFMQRITGKRTLSKMNSFDFIVTVALGSALANILLSDQVSLAEGLLAFALLMTLQYVVTWLSVRSDLVNRMVKSEAKLLVYQGQMLRDAMRHERVVESEILQAARSSGAADISDVEAMVLETDGTFSVVNRTDKDVGKSSLQDVKRPESEQ